jgi:hypothetical protein
VTAPILIASYWLDFDPEGLWKFGRSMEFAAVFTAYAALASASEPPRRYRLLQYAVYPVAAALSTLLIVMIWKEWFNPPAWRTVGVLAITLVALTIANPLLRRLRRSRLLRTLLSEPLPKLRYAGRGGVRSRGLPQLWSTVPRRVHPSENLEIRQRPVTRQNSPDYVLRVDEPP